MTGGSYAVGPVGPRVEPKPVDVRLTRMSGVVHNGVVIAILETYENGELKTYIVRPGDLVTVGGQNYLVRAIGRDYLIVADETTGRQTVLPLRSRTAGEGQR